MKRTLLILATAAVLTLTLSATVLAQSGFEKEPVLQGVNGLSSVVSFAAIAKTEDEARLVTGAVNMLARYHASIEPIATVTAPGPIIGRTASGTLVLPAPVDYVPWVERLTALSQRVDLKAPKRIAWLSGQMSPRAQKEVRARGWTVYESFTVAAER